MRNGKWSCRCALGGRWPGFNVHQPFKVYIRERPNDLRPRIARKIIAVLPHTNSPRSAVHFRGKCSWSAVRIDNVGSRGHAATLPLVTFECKRKITHRNGTFGNVAFMANEYDTGWEACEGTWDRLRWASGTPKHFRYPP